MGYHPPFLDFFKTPFSLLLIVVNVGIFFWLNKKTIPIESVATSASSILDRHEFWRAITSSFSHYNILHIIFNVASSWNVRTLEVYLGSSYFLIYLTILVILPPFLDALIRRKLFPEEDIWSIGYSCVVCGFMTLIETFQSSVNLFGFNLPWSIAPFVQIIMTSLLIPNASFIGHLSGVIIGYLIRWHLFDWLTPTLYYNLIPWISIFMFLNYVHTYPNYFTFIKISKVPFRQVRIQNGQIINV